MYLPYGDIPGEVVKKIFSTREFWLDIVKELREYQRLYVSVTHFLADLTFQLVKKETIFVQRWLSSFFDGHCFIFLWLLLSLPFPGNRSLLT